MISHRAHKDRETTGAPISQHPVHLWGVEVAVPQPDQAYPIVLRQLGRQLGHLRSVRVRWAHGHAG